MTSDERGRSVDACAAGASSRSPAARRGRRGRRGRSGQRGGGPVGHVATPSASASICSLRTSSVTVSCSVTVSVPAARARPATASLSTTGRSSCRTTSCSSSEMAGPSSGVADVGVGDRLALDADLLAAGPGRSCVSFSVTTYLRSRARPASRFGADAAAAPRSGSSRRRWSGRRCRGRRVPSVAAGGRCRCRVAAVGVGVGRRYPVAGVPVSGAGVPTCRRRSTGRARCSSAGERWPVGVHVGGVLDLGLVVGQRSGRRRPSASASGMKVSLVPNRPVLTVAHSGLPSSRELHHGPPRAISSHAARPGGWCHRPCLEHRRCRRDLEQTGARTPLVSACPRRAGDAAVLVGWQISRDAVVPSPNR